MTQILFFSSVSYSMFRIEILKTLVKSYVFYCKVIVHWFTGSLYFHCELALAHAKSLTACRHIMCINAMQSHLCAHRGAKNHCLFLCLSWAWKISCKCIHRLQIELQKQRAWNIRRRVLSKDHIIPLQIDRR